MSIAGNSPSCRALVLSPFHSPPTPTPSYLSFPPDSVEREVEWLYAFDVHCNAYIPGFILLHVVQVRKTPSPPPPLSPVMCALLGWAWTAFCPAQLSFVHRLCCLSSTCSYH